MAKRSKRKKKADSTENLIRNLMIVQMGLAGVGQREIRAVVGGSIDDVNSIVKHLKKSKRPVGRG